MAIFHRRFLDASFIVPFYKMILRRKIVFADLESVDVELHRGLAWVLYAVSSGGILYSGSDPHRRDNDITDVIEQTFTTLEERFGEMLTIELKPGGAEIPVTEENKQDYVTAIVEYRISKRVKDQFEALMTGFNEFIPRDILNVFDEQGLEFLISGISEIDVYVTYPSLLSAYFVLITHIYQRRLEQIHRLQRV